MVNKSLRGLISYISGHTAEKSVCRWLEKKGYELIAQNVTYKRGSNACELDLVMKKDKTIVFIEVKKRQTMQQALDAVVPQMQKRLYKGAQAFLVNNPQYLEYDCRFDVVCLDKDNAMTHLENVIEE